MMYVMLIGLPASGKTTLRQQIVETFPDHDWCEISTDDYIEALAAMYDATYIDMFASTIDVATKQTSAEFQAALGMRRNILHDQTNLTVKSRARKLSQVPKGYRKIAVVCQVPVTLRVERLANRSGKTIPAEIDAKMADSYESPTLGEFDIILPATDWREGFVI